MIKNINSREENYKKEQKFYNLEIYNLLTQIKTFEENNMYLKVTLKDSFPYQLILSSTNNGYENILTIIYDQQQVFEMEIIPEIIIRYSSHTIIKNSYFEENRFIAVMENDTVLELKDFEEKTINKLVGHIEKIQNITQYNNEFEYKLKVEEEKQNLKVIRDKEGSSNIVLITLILLALISIATIIIILLKNA